jgi:hypothetical protein
MKAIILLPLFSFFSIIAFAQHDHDHDHKAPAKPAPKKQVQTPVKKDTAKTSIPMTAKKDTVPQNHNTHDHGQPQTQQQQNPATHQHDVQGHEHTSSTSMSHAFSRNLPMTRNGSGTAWLPDNSPMYGYMYHTRKWMYMLHGNVYLRYNKQDLLNKGSRGDEKFDAPNMVMLMGQRNVGEKGLF